MTPPGLEIQMQVPPPPDDVSAYNFCPMTIAVTQDMASAIASTCTTAKVIHFIWGDRAIAVPVANSAFPNPRPNLIFPTIQTSAAVECRLRYTTNSKRRAAWLVKQRYSCGALSRGDARYPDGMGYLDLADAAGLTVQPWATLAASPSAYFTIEDDGYMVANDLVYLPTGRLVDCGGRGVGVSRDCEDQTLLSDDEIVATLAEAAASCAATRHPLDVYPNALNGGGAIATGFNARTMPRIAAIPNIRRIGIVAWPQNAEHDIARSLANQVALFGTNPPWPLIEVIVGIGAPGQEMTIADAQTVRRFIVANGIVSVNFWRDYASQGGALSRPANQIIATILGLPTS